MQVILQVVFPGTAAGKFASQKLLLILTPITVTVISKCISATMQIWWVIRVTGVSGGSFKAPAHIIHEECIKSRSILSRAHSWTGQHHVPVVCSSHRSGPSPTSTHLDPASRQLPTMCTSHSKLKPVGLNNKRHYAERRRLEDDRYTALCV